jgi:SAM-dependent methyltransferase
MRDYNAEYQNNESRKYAYDFDSIIRQYMMRTLAPYFGNGKALEIGCFEGESTILLSKYFEDLTVIEASDELIAIASRRAADKIRFIHATIATAAIEPIYDFIFLVHTLEHLDDPVANLALIKSWLSPKGKLFLVVPNAHAPSRQIAVKMGIIETNHSVTEAERLHGHRCTYSLDTLENDARAAELCVQTRGGIFFKPFANFQFDMLIKHQIIDQAYLEGCYELGMHYPELTSSIYVICTA